MLGYYRELTQESLMHAREHYILEFLESMTLLNPPTYHLFLLDCLISPAQYFLSL